MTALAQAGTPQRIPAFTVRYDDPDSDEGEYATAAAQRSSVEQHELRVGLDELPDLIADATWHVDEPMAFNASPELLAISRYASERVRVLLTGESADELFGGYGRFRQYRYLPLLKVTGAALRPVRGRFRHGSRWFRLSHATSLGRAEWIAASYADGDPGRFDASLGRVGRRSEPRPPDSRPTTTRTRSCRLWPTSDRPTSRASGQHRPTDHGCSD